MKKCDLDRFWQSALNGKPAPFKNLAGAERSAVENALLKLPKSFRPKGLKAIVRASQPADITSLTSPATSSNEFIILFPRAFSGSIALPRILAHESVHLLAANEWSQTLARYKKDSGWPATGRLPRKGDFVEADGKLSVDEDFANNIEYYLFEPQKLKTITPVIYEWILKNLGSILKLEKDCDYGS